MAVDVRAEWPVFTASVMINGIRATFRDLPDARKGGNHPRYTMEDAAFDAFSVLFTQSPSFLDHQVRMQKERGGNNATVLFGMHQISTGAAGQGVVARADERTGSRGDAIAAGSRRASDGEGDLKKGRGVLCEGVDVNYAWIEAHIDSYPIRLT